MKDQMAGASQIGEHWCRLPLVSWGPSAELHEHSTLSVYASG